MSPCTRGHACVILARSRKIIEVRRSAADEAQRLQLNAESAMATRVISRCCELGVTSVLQMETLMGEYENKERQLRVVQQRIERDAAARVEEAEVARASESELRAAAERLAAEKTVFTLPGSPLQLEE